MALSTLPGSSGPIPVWERALRLFSLSVIAVLVGSAGFGLTGVRTGLTRSAALGYEVAVEHAVVSRAGLPTPLDIEVRRPGGSSLPQVVTVRVDSDYLDMFDHNGIEPNPDASANTRRSTSWTFDVEPGTRQLRIEIDARLDPSVQWGRSGSVALVIDGSEVTSVRFRTWVMP